MRSSCGFEIFGPLQATSTGGVKDEKGLWLACRQATARVDVPTGPTAMLFFVLLNSLMSALFLSLRRRSHIGTKSGRHCLGPWSLTQPSAHLPGSELKIDCLFLRKPFHSPN